MLSCRLNAQNNNEGQMKDREGVILALEADIFKLMIRYSHVPAFGTNTHTEWCRQMAVRLVEKM